MTSIRDLISANLLSNGTQIIWHRKSLQVVHRALIQSDGAIQTEDGKLHKSPSGAAKHFGKKPVDGWIAWKVEATGQSLADLRNSYLFDRKG